MKDGVKLIPGDCLEKMREIDGSTIDSVVTDPPYGFSFMNHDWDYEVPDVEYWKEAIRLLKPGSHLLAFGGTRTYHRLVCAVENAGFEIRDCIPWVHSANFPKSVDVSKSIGKMLDKDENLSVGRDVVRKWNGWGTALKTACELIVLARKPIIGTVAENVAWYGTGGLNIEECRVESENGNRRWPCNLIHDGSEDVTALFPETTTGDLTGQQGGETRTRGVSIYGKRGTVERHWKGDRGSAGRFFYCAKAMTSERDNGCEKNTHPSVKPVMLMRYLCRLITPAGGTVLDPFMGSGSTGVAAYLEGFQFVGMELDAQYVEIAEKRIDAADTLDRKTSPDFEVGVKPDRVLRRIKIPKLSKEEQLDLF